MCKSSLPVAMPSVEDTYMHSFDSTEGRSTHADRVDITEFMALFNLET